MENYKIDDDLVTLRIKKKLEDISISEVIKAFRKAAIDVHPDKTGTDTNEEFKELSNACQRILKIVYDRIEQTNEKEEKDEDLEESFTKDNFQFFNFPTDKEGNFVVIVQNELADSWSNCFEATFGIPTINKTKSGLEIGRMWKVEYMLSELTIHFYNKPKTNNESKFLIQGRDARAKYLFVFNELPLIYKEVCSYRPSQSVKKKKPVKLKLYNCTFCKVKSKTLSDLRKHSLTKHSKYESPFKDYFSRTST